MRLDARGTPLHSRALTIVVARRAEGGLAVEGTLVDVRKRGFVPVAGDLQGSGLIHHMRLLATATADGDRLESIVADQPSVAFEPTATTAGESCRDPIRAVEALAGAPIDAELARRTSTALGGPRGCSHLLTLAHLLGATLLSVRPRLAAVPSPGWRPGERIFRRDLVVDGSEPAAGVVQLAAQLTDLAFVPAPARARPMARFGAAYELRALADVEWPGLAVRALAVADRSRAPDTLDVATWASRDDAVADLAGLRLGGGAASTLLARFGDAADRPLLDTLLMLAPALIQCAAALSDPWAALYRTNPSEIALGGLPDSCYMWRRDGALDKLRGEAPPPTLPGRGPR
jgi:hypothetical protein